LVCGKNAGLDFFSLYKVNCLFGDAFMFGFRQWLLNEVSDRVMKELEQWSRQNQGQLPFSDLFASISRNKGLRQVVPLQGANRETAVPQSILDKLQELGMEIDYQKGLAEDSNGRSYRLGKYILGKNSSFTDEHRQWWVKSGNPVGVLEFVARQNRYMVVISRSPVDVVRMSDHDGWTSCHGQGGSYFQCAISDAKGAGGIAYVVRRDDLRGVNLQDPEIFVDPDRGVRGIKPIARLRLRQLMHKEAGYDLAVPEERVYGAKVPGFLETVRKWALEQQEEKLDGRRPRLAEFILKGGGYQDTKASRLLNHLFGDDLDRGDVEHEEGGDIFAQYEREVEEISEEYRNFFKHVFFHATVEDSEGNPYVYYRGWLRLEFPEGLEITLPDDMKKRREIMKWAGDNLYGSVEDYEIKGNSITFDIADSSGNMDPDGFRGFIEDELTENEKGVEKYVHDLYRLLVDLRLVKSTKAYDVHGDISRLGEEERHFQNFDLNDQEEQHIELNLREGILVDQMTQEEISRNLPYPYAEKLQSRLMVEINKWADQYHAALLRQGRMEFASRVERPFKKEFSLVPEVRLTNAGGMVKNIYFQMDLNINIMSADRDVEELFEFLHFLDKNYEGFVKLVKYVYNNLKVV
jgi:hypothetical protein